MLNQNDSPAVSRSNRLIIVFIVVSGLIIGGGFFWLALQREAEPYKTTNSNPNPATNVTLEDQAMEPTLLKGTVVRFSARPVYNRGEIVWLNDPQTGPTTRQVRRIVAVAGDSLKANGGALYLNNNPITDFYGRFEAEFGPVSLGPGQIFVLCDNPLDRRDSRSWGPIPVNLVRGSQVK